MKYLLILPLITGCMTATIDPSSAEFPVRVINADAAKSCTFITQSIGYVQNNYVPPHVNITNAQYKAAATVASAGADAGVMVSTDVSNKGKDVAVTIDGYRCT